MADDIKKMYAKARKAFEQIEYWSQEKVDEMVAAVGWEWQKPETAKALARLAVDESGIGVYEDKVAKIQSKTRGTMRDLIGRNAMIVSPHPRTQGSSYLTVEHGRKALAKIGAPVDLLQCIKETSREKTRELMAGCDFAVATGGAALVRVVYEAGKPCHTVGAGNVISIVGETADIKAAAAKIVKSKTANNSASCSSENAVAIEASVYDDMLQALKAEGGYLCNTDEREKLRKYMWPDGKTLNRDIVAKPALYIAEHAGINVPENTRFIMVLGTKPGPEDRFSGEKVSLVLTVWKWTDFSEMIERMKEMQRFSGEGHSSSIHTEIDDRKIELALKANVGPSKLM
jgi:sulfoacetaldehyde dehydrogenase